MARLKARCLIAPVSNGNIADWNLLSRGEYVTELELRFKSFGKPGQLKGGLFLNSGFSGAYMPQNVVVGQDALNVAKFVSTYAGRQEPREPGTVPCQAKPIGTLPPGSGTVNAGASSSSSPTATTAASASATATTSSTTSTSANGKGKDKSHKKSAQS